MVSSVSAASPEPRTASARSRFDCEHLGDPVLDGALADQPVHLDGPGLADAVRAVGGLVLDGRVPPAVVVDDVVGAGEVEPGAGGLERQQEHRAPRPPGSRSTISSRSGDRGAAVQELRRRRRGRARCRSSSRRHRDVLREDQDRAVLGEDRVEQLVEQLELARAAARAGRGSSFRYCAGWLQICLSAVSSLTQPAPARCPRRSSISARVSRTTASYSAACSRGEGDGLVGLGLGRQLGRDAGVGLAAAQQERPDEPGEPLGDARVARPPRSARAQRCAELPRACRAARAWSSRGSPTARRGCSPRVPVSATRASAGIVRSAWAVPTSGFFTCCASSATTRPQRCSASASASRAHRAVGREDEPVVGAVAGRAPAPWKRRTGMPGANLLDLPLPVAEQRGRADDEGGPGVERLRGAGAGR